MLEDLLNFRCECTTGWTGATCERSKDTHFDPDEKFIKFSRDKINLNPIRNLKKRVYRPPMYPISLSRQN